MTIGAIRSTGLTASRALAEWAASKLFPGETREEVDEPVMPAPGKMFVYILEKLFFSNSQV